MEGSFYPKTAAELDQYLEQIKKRKDPAILRRSEVKKLSDAIKVFEDLETRLIKLFDLAMKYVAATKNLYLMPLQFPVPYLGFGNTWNYDECGALLFRCDERRRSSIIYERKHGIAAQRLVYLSREKIPSGLTRTEIVALWKSSEHIFTELCFICGPLEEARKDIQTAYGRLYGKWPTDDA